MHSRLKHGTLMQVATLGVALLIASANCLAQKKTPAQPRKSAQAQPANNLAKLRDEYIKATKDYKASSQKLLTLYQDSLRKAEQRRDQTEKLFAEGLISKRDVEQAERAVTDANLKVIGVEQQIATADTQ